MKLSLKVRISILLFLIISVPLFVSGIISYKLAANALQTTIEEELRTTTSSAAKSVESELEAVGNYLEIASKNSTLADFAASPASEGEERRLSVIFPVFNKTTPSCLNR